MKRTLLAAAAVLALASCGIDHIRTLRDAEETFSRAADQENRGRFSTPEAVKVPVRERDTGGAGLASKITDGTGYRIAAEMTAKLIREKRAELEQDKLLCTAYVIRAFSLWRLGEFDDAVEASRQQCGSAAPRDSALLKVVGALVGIDESNARAFNAEKSAKEQQTTQAQLESALKDLDAADKSLTRDHPLRAYLFAAQLAALRVAQVSPNREGLDDTAERALREDALKRADLILVEYRKYLRCELRLQGEIEHPSVPYWRNLFGTTPLSAKPPACLTP